MSFKRVKQLQDFRWPSMPRTLDEVVRYLGTFRQEFDEFHRKIGNLATNVKYFGFPRMSTTERDGFDPLQLEPGQTIYNTSLNEVQFWNGTTWKTITST